MKPHNGQPRAARSSGNGQSPLSSKRLQPRTISKRTRDLPDLTECHSCGFRTDSCSGGNGLRILYSEWRIILLCGICFERVESSQICSYCFKETASSCFTCGQCRRIVHASCFSRYTNSPPWSYSSSASGFWVCVDCWLPVTVARKRGLLVRRSIRKGKNSSGLGDSKSLEDVVKDASSPAVKNFESAIRTKDLDSSNVLNFITGRDVSYDSIKYNTNDAGFNVTGLALQSCGSMDNSSAILSNLCSVNLDSVVLPMMRVCNRKPVIRFTYSTYSRRRRIGISQPPVSIISSSHGSTTCPDSLKTIGIHDVDTGACLTVGNGEVKLEEREGSFSNKFTSDHVVDNGMTAASDLFSEEDESIEPENERCDENRPVDRYMMKYSRRKLK